MTNAMIKANLGLIAIHPLDALEVDEEGILLEHTFMSFFDSYADIPEYTDWMWNTDQVPAYRYLKRMACCSLFSGKNARYTSTA